MPNIIINQNISGSILDLGGGGECVIGRVYGARVTAIDNRREELDEAPDCCTKLLMDACDLTLDSFVFDHVTAFYFFMYLGKAEHKRALAEARRVLRDGGMLHIWDCEMETADPFVVNLDIQWDGGEIHADYGIYKDDAAQGADYFVDLCASCGFALLENHRGNGQFHLIFEKR